VLKQLSKYLGVKLLEMLLLPFVLFGGSYVLSLVVDFWKKGGFMSSVLPPLFFPILAASFVIVLIFLRVRQNRKEHLENEKLEIRRKQKTYCKKVKDAHSAIKALFINSSLNKQVYVEAWEKISLVHVELLEKRKKAVPKKILDPNDRDSVIVWYKFLVSELARCGREEENV